MTTTRCALALLVLLSIPAAAQGDSKRLERALLELRASSDHGPQDKPLFPPGLTIDRVEREGDSLHLFLGGKGRAQPAEPADYLYPGQEPRRVCCKAGSRKRDYPLRRLLSDT